MDPTGSPENAEVFSDRQQPQQQVVDDAVRASTIEAWLQRCPVPLLEIVAVGIRAVLNSLPADSCGV